MIITDNLNNEQLINRIYAAAAQYELLFWNSGAASGKGAISSMEYNGSGPVFTHNSKAFVWKSSVSKM